MSCIEAISTASLALPKTGFISKKAHPYVSTSFLAVIGIPIRVYREVTGRDRSIFKKESIIKLGSF